MRILRAQHLGMCFGVRDAIQLARTEAARSPLTILGDLVHNETVLDDLAGRGIRTTRRPEEVRTAAVMITAHGASHRAIAAVEDRGLRVVEATCPLVHFAHRCVDELVRRGCHPVVVGKRDHVEVRGLTEDLAAFDVILTSADVEALREYPRYGVVAQTTQPVERVRQLVELLRRRFPGSEVVFRDTVCQPTKQRQLAAIQLACRCDVVVVIGGAHSNNTRELVDTCARHCGRVHHVQTAADLRAEWFEDADTVGFTAGTSTPDETIRELEQALHDFADAAVARTGETPDLAASETLLHRH
jgi:4-hydroxy-3-methylbut-2-enyl diphosphate reductase